MFNQQQVEETYYDNLSKEESIETIHLSNMFIKELVQINIGLTIVMTFLVRECYGSPKISIKFVKIRQNSLKFMPEECYDKVLNEEF
jgi:hypothetical protein